MKQNRVVITGIGITSSLGHTMNEVSLALQKGENNFAMSNARKEMGFTCCLEAVVPPETKYQLDRRKRRFMSDSALYCALSWLKAIDQCNLKPQDFCGTDIGIITGNDSSSQPLEELMDTLEKYKETHFLGSNMVIKVMNSCCSMNLGPLIGARGINVTMSGGDASGSHAIGYAYSLIKNGKQQAIISGGFQETNWIPIASFDALGILTSSQDTATALCPFDAERSGTIPGGGGALLILENLERAQKLQHKIYGEIIGYGFSSGKTVANYKACIHNALSKANLHQEDIEYINASASSVADDYLEAQAIHEIFADCPIVSATKAITGHEFWMSGASELIYCLLMMQDKFIAPTMNYKQPKPHEPMLNIANKTIYQKPNVILSNNFGLSGTNTSLIIKEFSE